MTDRKINAIYHCDEGIYRTEDGRQIVPEKFEWDFPCKECRGPAENYSVDTYYEYYRCLNCGHKFKVN